MILFICGGNRKMREKSYFEQVGSLRWSGQTIHHFVIDKIKLWPTPYHEFCLWIMIHLPRGRLLAVPHEQILYDAMEIQYLLVG